MLSSQTKDEVVHQAIANLRRAEGGQITLEAMLAARHQVILTAIGKVGFLNKKTE
jgi:endonuclease-3